MFRGMGGLIGPYGGTKESEYKRPMIMALTAIAILFLMLLGLVPTFLLAGDFLAPVLLIAVTLLSRQKAPVTEDEKVAKRYAARERALYYAYWACVVATLFTVYIGGFPIKWQATTDRLLISWQGDIEEWQGEVADNKLWLATNDWGIGIDVPADLYREIESGKTELWLRHDSSIEFSLPLWADTFRWLIVLTLVIAECVGVLLVARLLTEVLFPSLPNSVRARPGFLGRIFPWMTIKNAIPTDEELAEDESALPLTGDEAPWR